MIPKPDNHSLFGPSKSHQYLACPASVALCKNLVSTTSEHADEGKFAHRLAEACAGLEVRAGGADPVETLDGRSVPREMRDHVDTYLDFCSSISEGCIAKWVEEKLDLSSVLGIHGEIGTADFICLQPSGTLHVVDLKYGFNAVSATDNSQGMLYALGALSIATFLGEVNKVMISIVQPRVSEFPSMFEISVADLLAFGEAVRGKVKYALSLYNDSALIQDADIVPGVKQCKYCEAGKQGRCAKAYQQALGGTVLEFENCEIKNDDQLGMKIEATTYAVPAQDSVTSAWLVNDEDFARIYSHIDELEALCKAIRARAYNELMDADGPRFGHKLVAGKRGNRKWNDDVAAEKAMKTFRLKMEEMYKFSVVSPAVAEKLLAKAHPKQWNKIKLLIEQKPGAPTVVPESDARPRWVKPSLEFENLDKPEELEVPKGEGEVQ